MPIFPLLFCLFAAFYVAFGWLVLRQFSRGSCRICLHRQHCPNRLRVRSDFTQLPVYRQPAECLPEQDCVSV